jgi:hypothetical protein
MGYTYAFIVIFLGMWVVRKIMDIDERTKEISRTLTEITDHLNSKEHT